MRDITEQYHPEAMRYLSLSSDNGSTIDYSEENLKSAKAALDHFYTALREYEELIAIAEMRLRDPFAPLDDNRFRISVADLRADLPAATVEAYRTVVDSLTAACRGCHVVEQATIKRVQKDQRSLHLAEFDHGAHTIHTRCLDCHNAIPIREYAAERQDAPPDLDNADIVNLPTIAACRTCHTDSKAADDCTACHEFLPGRPLKHVSYA